MACQIKRNADGTIAQVLAPNGKDSILYRDIVNNLSNPQVLTQVKQDPYVSMVLGTEYIKGTDVSEVGLAAWSKAYSADFIDQFGDWKTQTIANTDVNGEPSVDALFPSTQITSTGPATFDKQLAQKIQAKLQALYPEIKLNITNNPVWEQGDNVFNQEQFNLEVNYRLKTTKVVLDNYNKIRQWESNKSINQDTLYKKIGELGISKQQLDLLKNSEGNTVEEKLASFTANYSYTVEINTAKQKTENIKQINATYFEVDGIDYTEAFGSWFKNEGTTKISYDEYKKALDKYNQQNVEEKPTQHYSNLTVPGGTNYRENEIATPAITPSIKGHAQFATDKGIGWFRSDVKTDDTFTGETYIDEEYGFDDNDGGQPITKEVEKKITKERTPTKTRRILEVQSDLFQKGRNKEQLIGIDFDLQGAGYTFGSRNQYKIIDEYNDEIVFKDTETGDVYKKPKEWLKEQNKKVQVKKSENQFLQLLNKDNNWVNFFVKAIIQDSAEKGYEKVLFPSGNTASKVEGHTTLEEFKKQKEDRIKKLEKENEELLLSKEDEFADKIIKGDINTQIAREKYLSGIDTEVNQNNKEITQLKQELERIETEGFGALKPIYNFYENTVANVLKKQGYNPKTITDEYGNTWNEVNINQARDLSEILLQRNKANQIIGQANIKALTVLIDAVNQKQDTLPHEYAHHYIAWYRNTPIVQEAIKKWGSEEALVQAIGEQVVKQKGEAYNWWKNFVRWILNQFNKLSTLQKEELAKILTDAFLTRQDLNIQLNTTQPAVKEGVDFVFEQNPELSNIGTQEQYSEYLNTIFPNSAVKNIMYHGGNTFEELKPNELGLIYFAEDLEYADVYKKRAQESATTTKALASSVIAEYTRLKNAIAGLSNQDLTTYDTIQIEKAIDYLASYTTNTVDQSVALIIDKFKNNRLDDLSINPEFGMMDEDGDEGSYYAEQEQFNDYYDSLSEQEKREVDRKNAAAKKQQEDLITSRFFDIVKGLEKYQKEQDNSDYIQEALKVQSQYENIQAEGKLYSAVLNVKNPQYTDENISNESIKEGKIILDKSKDSLIGKDALFYKRVEGKKITVEGKNVVAVKNSAQVYMLGTPQDIEGFKRFVSKPTTPISDEWTNVKNNCPKLI